MKKLIYRKPFTQDKLNIGFAFLPTIVLEAHPSESRWHLIWWECYEVTGGKKWLISNI